MGIDELLRDVVKFDDNTYLYLMNKDGEEKVEKVINRVLNDRDMFLKICELVKLDSDYYNVVIEKILLARINIIKKEIDNLSKQSGIDLSKINLLYDKVVCINSKDIDSAVKDEINSLYQEFIRIRDGIWHYYLPMLNEILEKYIDDEKYDDLYQEAAMTLMTVIEKFGDSNYDFKEYAEDYIRYSINYHYHDLDLCLDMSMNRRHKYYKMDKIIYDYVVKYQKMPTKEELSKMLKLPMKTILAFLSFDIFDTVSLSNNDMVDGEYVKNEEVIGNGEDIRYVENMAIDDNLGSLVRDLLTILKDKEKMVIYDYFLASKPLTNGEIAEKLGVSYGTEMNIKRKALSKLRRHKDELGKYLR